MEMQHAKMLKNDLEKTITQMVKDFEIQTGLKVDGFSIYNVQEMGKSKQTQRIEIDTTFR